MLYTIDKNKESMIKYKYHIRKKTCETPKTLKKGGRFRKIAKLDRMNTRFKRGAVEITLDLIKGLLLNSSRVGLFMYCHTYNLKI